MKFVPPSVSAALLQSTGSQAWNAANNDAINLSGNATITGTSLSAIKVTGSNIINIANLTGIGGSIVLYSGNQIFISGGLGGGNAGVSNLNGLQNSINIIGTGGLFITTSSQNIIISGSSWALSNDVYSSDLNISGNLTITGQTLENQIIGLSGQLNNLNYVGITGDQIISGSKIFNNVINTQLGYFIPSITLTGVYAMLGSEPDLIYINFVNSNPIILPVASGTISGRAWTIKLINTGAVSVVSTTAIDGQSGSYWMNMPYSAQKFICDGVNYYTIP